MRVSTCGHANFGPQLFDEKQVGPAFAIEVRLSRPALSNIKTPPATMSPREKENEYVEKLLHEIKTSANPNAELNRLMTLRKSDPLLAAPDEPDDPNDPNDEPVTRRGDFAFKNEDEVKEVFKDLMTAIFEPEVTAWLPGITPRIEIALPRGARIPVLRDSIHVHVFAR